MQSVNECISEIEPVEIKAPASKSLSHRYMIGAALANGESVIRNILESADLEATRRILSTAGAEMTPLRDDLRNIIGWRIKGMAGKPMGGTQTPLQCDVGESGTTCRLLTAVLAAGQGLFHIFGHGRMHDRPIGELCTILSSLGSAITYEGKPDCPPILINAHGLNPGLVDGYVRMGMDDSSQFFSGLLLASPMASSPLCIELAGNKVVSWPYVGLTLQCMHDFGLRFQVEKRSRIGVPWIDLRKTSWRNLNDARPGCLRVRIWPGEYHPGDYYIEGDWSGASYFLAAGALGKKPVKVTGLRADSLQGDRAIIDILQKMGAKVVVEENAVTVYPSVLHGVALDMGSCPDLVPTVVVLAAYAKGSTRIGNVAHLRLKESDRIAAPAEEMGKTGVTVDMLSDGLLINGMGGTPPLRNRPNSPILPENSILSAHNDHRIAMSLALLELRQPNLSVHDRIDKPEVVCKSFPRFWDVWSKLQ